MLRSRPELPATCAHLNPAGPISVISLDGVLGADQNDITVIGQVHHSFSHPVIAIPPLGLFSSGPCEMRAACKDSHYSLMRDYRHLGLREWTRISSRLVVHTAVYASFSIERTSQAVQDVAIRMVSLSGASASCILVRRTELSIVELARTFHATSSWTALTLPMDRRVPSLELDSWHIEEESALRNS